MSKTVTVRAMIDPKKKERVSKILSRLGINHSEAINIFYSFLDSSPGLPFNVQLPSKGTPNNNIRPEVLSSLKESVKKNHRLGELLAK